MQSLLKETVSKNQLPAFAKSLSEELARTPGFALAMHGDLGTGKTTIAGHLLRAFGLPLTTPVNSPTFAYMNQYKIGTKQYFHIDMYRSQSFPFTSEEELFGGTIPDGVLVEWPQFAESILTFTHDLFIENPTEDTRLFRLEKR